MTPNINLYTTNSPHTHTNTNIHTQLKCTLKQGGRDREGKRKFNLFKDSWGMLLIYNIFIFGNLFYILIFFLI